MPKNKYTLDSDLDFDFDLIGISCREKSHKMAWLLNTHLKFKFKRINNFKLSFKNHDQNHDVYEYEDYYSDIFYTLIKNKADNGYLAKEQSVIDYFIIIKTNYGKISPILKQIREIRHVLLATEINVLELKSKEHFIQ
jgi:hypothetical protein